MSSRRTSGCRSFAPLLVGLLACVPARAACEIDRATFRPVDEAAAVAGQIVGNSATATGPTLRAFVVGGELRWELEDGRSDGGDGRPRSLLFRTDIDRLTGRWTVVAQSGDLGLTSAVVRYDANGLEVADGGEVVFVRLDGLTPAALPAVPDLPRIGLWVVVACREP